MFVVLAPHTTPSGVIKAGTKLDETRIYPERPDHLISYSWETFRSEVTKLLKAAKARLPAIRERLAQQQQCHTGAPASMKTTNDLTNNLRELAAAANAIQSSDNGCGAESRVHKGLTLPTTSAINTSSTRTMHKEITTAWHTQPAPFDLLDPDSTWLPRYVIKTVGHNGWEVIENAEQWDDLLSRRGREVWADGVINMVVELVDIPVPAEWRVP